MKVFPVYYLTITYLHVSTWIKFSATYSAAFSHIQNVRVEVDLSTFPNLMFIGPCIIVIVQELETNLMSLVIFITLNMCSTCFGH